MSYEEQFQRLGRVENLVFLDEILGVGIYMLFAKEASATQAQFLAILPFATSTRLDELKLASGHSHVMLIVFCPKERGVHISMRGGGGVLDCGAMCSQLVGRLRGLYPEQEEGIEGGGHDHAAECMVDKPVPMYAVMHELLALVQEMSRIAKALESGGVKPEDAEKARSLGLDRNLNIE